MENQTQTVAQQTVDMMARAGIKHMYAITGDSLNALTDAICNDGRIKFVHMRHEESGAFAASAEAQLTGSLACCAGSSGPGHVHLINGLYDAQRSDAPVFAIASTCASNFFGTEYFQETDPTLLFSNCNVYNHTAVTAAQAPHMVQAAMQEAVSRGGVGIVGLPADTIGLQAQSVVTSMEPVKTDRLPEPTVGEIQQAADIINSAKTVAVFAGVGCQNATEELTEFIDKVNATLTTTYKSQLMLMNCPNYVGHMGYLGMWSGEQAVADADAILIIGMHFPFPGFFPTDKKIIQVDVRPERIGRVAKVDLGVRADAAVFLSALTAKVDAKPDKTFAQKALANYAEILEKFQEPVKHPGSKGNIRPEYMLHTLDRLADDNAVFTVDTGMNNVWTSHYLTAARDRKMVGSFMHGSMANAMPMSIGAAMACPDRQVIAVCGDGGMSMLMGDLLTIIQYQLPVKVLVADNRSLAYVQWEMELAGIKPNEVSLTNPDFGDMARSMGFQAETVDDPAQLEDAMKRWLQAKGPALLSVVTDPDAASFSFSKEMMQNARPGLKTSNFMAPGSI